MEHKEEMITLKEHQEQVVIAIQTLINYCLKMRYLSMENVKKLKIAIQTGELK